VDTKRINKKVIWAISIATIGFGLLTLKSGGFALFGGEAGKQFAGDYVPFVLWFNFCAGLFYIASGVGIFFKKSWGVDLGITIASLTAIVFALFGVYILSNGAYEVRTLGAMTFRTLFWVVISFFAAKQIKSNLLNKLS